jgi:hypothetical protein
MENPLSISILEAKKEEMEKIGLYKGKTSWHLPSASIGSGKALV